MSAKFPRGGGGAGPFLARSLYIFVRNLRKMTANNANLDLVNTCINAYTKVAVRLI